MVRAALSHRLSISVHSTSRTRFACPSCHVRSRSDRCDSFFEFFFGRLARLLHYSTISCTSIRKRCDFSSKKIEIPKKFILRVYIYVSWYLFVVEKRFSFFPLYNNKYGRRNRRRSKEDPRGLVRGCVAMVARWIAGALLLSRSFPSGSTLYTHKTCFEV